MRLLPNGELYLEDEDRCEFDGCGEYADCVLIEDHDETAAHAYCDVHGGMAMFGTKETQS